MHGSQRAPPAIERCCGRAKIVLEKPRVTIRAGKEPNMLVAALPCSPREEGSYRSSCARSCQQTVKKISARTEECDQPFADWPGIVAGATVERRRRHPPVATRTGKKDIEFSAADFQLPAQVKRPRVLVRNAKRLPWTPLSGIH